MLSFGQPRVFHFPGTTHIKETFSYAPHGETTDGGLATLHGLVVKILSRLTLVTHLGTNHRKRDLTLTTVLFYPLVHVQCLYEAFKTYTFERVSNRLINQDNNEM